MNIADYDVLQLRPRSIVKYRYWDGDRKKRVIGSSGWYDISQERNNTKGVLSDNSIRKIRYAVQLLEHCSPTFQVMNERTQTPYPFKLGFLTLTLPCAQGNVSDEEIKRKALMPYLTALQKKFGNFSYVWKAEAQQNGNIHFHLTLNKWIHYNYLRHYWNRCLSKLGYISEYKRQQLEFHSEGFKLRPEALKYWSEEAQGIAYNYGMATNWSNPNTTDIHAVKNVQNLSAYLIKYMSKKETDKRPIKGKIWGCSRNLTYNNKFEVVETGLTLKENRNVCEVFKSVKMDCAFVKVYIKDEITFQEQFSEQIVSKYKAWINDIYNYK